MTTKEKRALPFDQRWPDISRILNPDKTVQYMVDKVNEEPNQTSEKFRERFHEYLESALEEAPKKELIDALSETLGATIIQAVTDGVKKKLAQQKQEAEEQEAS